MPEAILLSHDDLTSNYLVYNPLSFDRPDDDWLINIKLYIEEFRTNLISIWMDEMGLVSSFKPCDAQASDGGKLRFERCQAQSDHDAKPVTVNLLSASRKISNMIFSLNFYQKDALESNREAATYQVYFVDAGGKQISDVQKIIADKAISSGITPDDVGLSDYRWNGVSIKPQTSSCIISRL